MNIDLTNLYTDARRTLPAAPRYCFAGFSRFNIDGKFVTPCYSMMKNAIPLAEASCRLRDNLICHEPCDDPCDFSHYIDHDKNECEFEPTNAHAVLVINAQTLCHNNCPQCSQCPTKFHNVDNSVPVHDLIKFCSKLPQFKTTQVEISGGEPLLHSNLSELLHGTRYSLQPKPKLFLFTAALEPTEIVNDFLCSVDQETRRNLFVIASCHPSSPRFRKNVFEHNLHHFLCMTASVECNFVDCAENANTLESWKSRFYELGINMRLIEDVRRKRFKIL